MSTLRTIPPIHHSGCTAAGAVAKPAILVLMLANAGMAQFTTVMNIPPDPDIGEYGFLLESHTQVNLYPGGRIGPYLQVGDVLGDTTNIELNIIGGVVGGFEAASGTTVNIRGGSIGGVAAHAGSEINIHGGEFLLNGAVISQLDTPGSRIRLDFSDFEHVVLTGTLVDGTPIALALGDYFVDAKVTLISASLPPIGPVQITVPSDPVPTGIRSGQTVILNDGGSLGDNFTANPGSALFVNGGQVGGGLEAVGAQVLVAGGSVGDSLSVLQGSSLILASGQMGRNVSTLGSHIEVQGGTIGDYFTNEGSSIEVSGGRIGAFFTAFESQVDVSGGTFGNMFNAFESSVALRGGAFDIAQFWKTPVDLQGGDFRLNGIPIEGLDNLGDMLNVDPPYGNAVLSGTLANGTPFAFSGIDNDRFFESPLTLTRTAIPAIIQMTINLPGEPAPPGVRLGQTLVLNQAYSLAG